MNSKFVRIYLVVLCIGLPSSVYSMEDDLDAMFNDAFSVAHQQQRDAADDRPLMRPRTLDPDSDQDDPPLEPASAHQSPPAPTPAEQPQAEESSDAEDPDLAKLSPAERAALDAKIAAAKERIRARPPMSPERLATLRARTEEIKRRLEERRLSSEHKPLFSIPLDPVASLRQWWRGRPAPGVLHSIAAEIPGLPATYRPGGERFEALASMGSVVAPQRLTVGKNDIARYGYFGAELWILSRLYAPFVEKRARFMTKYFIEHASETIALLESFDDLSRDKIKAALKKNASSYRMVTWNPLTVRRAGMLELIKSWLAYEATAMVNRMTPVHGSRTERARMVFFSRLPAGLSGEQPDWKKNLSMNDTSISSGLWWLRTGMLGKDTLIADLEEKVTGALAYVAQFMGEPLYSPTSPHFKKVLPYLMKFFVAHQTYANLDAELHSRWVDYLTRKHDLLLVHLYLIEQHPVGSRKRALETEKLYKFIAAGHKPDSTGVVMSLLQGVGGKRMRKFDRHVVAKAAMMMTARLRAERNLNILKSLPYLLPIMWRYAQRYIPRIR